MTKNATAWYVEFKHKNESDDNYVMDTCFTSTIIQEYNGNKLKGADLIDHEFDLGLLRATFHMAEASRIYTNLEYRIVKDEAMFDETGQEVILKGVTV